MNDRRPLLLDTHIWFWLARRAEDKLSREEIGLAESAAREEGLLLSAVSVWELSMLESKGRITLDRPLELWIDRALEMPGLTLAPLTPAIAIESTRLPGVFHGDPADRIIAATARRMGARLMTRGRQLLAYGKSGHLRLA